MPDDLKALHTYIRQKAIDGEISNGVATYAVGWIFFDIFERATHEEEVNKIPVNPADFDRFVKDLPLAKIDRDIFDAQQSFGSDAAGFMEEETERRIRASIDNSIVATVKGFTSGWKSFSLNVIAGVVAGLIFAAVSLGLYFLVIVDPSVTTIGKVVIEKNT